MAAETTPAAAPMKKIRRLQIGVNVLVQVALLVFLALMVNYLGFEHYRRWDFTRDKKFELSDKTKRFLASMKGKARATVFFSPNNPITNDVQTLLTEYQYAAKGKLDVENIDPERNFSRAKEVFDKYKVVSEESLVILDYDGRSKTVKASEMAEVDPGNPMLGEQPKVAAFKGEQALTSALIDLVEGKKNLVGYVLGHKEPVISDAPPPSPMMPPQQQQPASPIAVLKMFIENENIKFQELTLSELPAIPEDIKTVFIDGPQYDFSDREMKMLRDFWEKQGRILLLLDPAAKTPKLDAFLSDLGVRVNDDRLMAMMKTGIQEIARVRDVVGRYLPDTPITKRLGDVRGMFVGGTSSLTLDQARVQAGNVKLQPLIEAQKGYWAETDYNSTDATKMQENAVKNSGAPLVFAASVEKGGSGDDRVQTNSSRLVVVANSSFVQDAALTQDQQALDFVSASVNWLMNREQLIGIAPKVPKTLTFTLDESALRNLRWLILVLMPLVPAVIGGAVWWQRRA
ncbi:MAG: GldG family protein [Verrucomicrobiota bacterium]|nr:GldG family protein [Verrucomicrobiota bacterium]